MGDFRQSLKIEQKTKRNNVAFALPLRLYAVIMDAVQQIREKGLKATPARMEVIRAIGNDHLAYSHGDMEMLFDAMDRVTLYRVLKDFEDAGIVHKIIDFDGVTRFALCRNDCPDGHHDDSHINFHCKTCDKMFCLDAVEAPPIKLPAGFKATGAQMVVYGYCDRCCKA